ncbi:MAG: ChbG/HpnK family deacetylase [Planctomycetota bacterium]|nr:ChbG/HpnK family deacetylase [Planctomycetota bacterium]
MRSPSAPLAVVVTADDFGIGPRTSEGIIEAHLRGPVTATSLMVVTREHARASISLLEKVPALDVGLHVVLTHCGHKPLAAGRSSGLVGRDGFFLSNSLLWLKAYCGGLSKVAVADEIAAQADMFRAFLGRNPTHVDCHHHAHQLPTTCDALIDVIEQGILPPVTRTTIEPPRVSRNVSGARTKRWAAGFAGRRAAAAFGARGIASNDYFIGMLAAGDLKKKFPWQGFLDNLPSAGLVEWVVHPGLRDDTLLGRDDYSLQRVDELEALTGPDGAKTRERMASVLARKSLLFQSPPLTSCASSPVVSR